MSSISQEKSISNKKEISHHINNKNDNNKQAKEKYKILPENHPLEFYALGKINKNLYNNSSVFSTLSPITSPRLKVNNSTNNLFDRNILSVNHSYFINLKQNKNTESPNELNKNEKNYLNPILVYKKTNDEIKEYQKRKNINSLEWFNLIRNKLFSIDDNSRIKNGENISRNQFYEKKNKIILSPIKIKDNSFDNCNKNNTSYQLLNKSDISDGYDYNYNTNRSIENIISIKRFKKDNEKLNKIKKIIIKPEKINDYWQKLRIQKSHSTDALISKEFKKYDEKDLKNNFMYFDKNYKNIIRHKNWWKIDQ